MLCRCLFLVSATPFTPVLEFLFTVPFMRERIFDKSVPSTFTTFLVISNSSFLSRSQWPQRGCYLIDGVDFCWIAGMRGVYFLVYGFMGRETGEPANMNGLWIDRWYMRQDWIRSALAAAAITSLFYAENCKKSNPLPCCRLMGRAFRVELRVSFTVKKHKKYRL